MSESMLTHENAPPAEVAKSHGTAALGPSDSSDSGSDFSSGAPQQGDLLDSDTDRHGTGERAAAEQDAATAVDSTLTVKPEDDIDADVVDDVEDAKDEDVAMDDDTGSTDDVLDLLTSGGR